MTITQLAIGSLAQLETQAIKAGTDMAKIGPKEAALQAQRADLSIPAALDRTKGMTKADFDRLHEKLGKPAPKFKAKVKVVKPTHPATLTDVDKKAISDLKKDETMKAKTKKQQKADYDKARREEKKAARDAVKKAKQSDPVDALLAPNRKDGPSKPQAKPTAGAKPQPVAKSAPEAKPASDAPKPAKKPSKMDLATDMLKTEKGATQAELHALTGWKHTNVKELAARAKMKLVAFGEGRMRLV
jgi:hypothetical protein